MASGEALQSTMLFSCEPSMHEDVRLTNSALLAWMQLRTITKQAVTTSLNLFAMS